MLPVRSILVLYQCSTFNHIYSRDFSCSFGFDSNRRGNIHFLANNVIMSSVGNLVSFLDLSTGQQTYLPGPRRGGIGSLAVHPSGKFIAIAEVHESPVIYILNYPELKIHRILRNGTTRAYSNLCFNKTGDKIASVGSDPGIYHAYSNG